MSSNEIYPGITLPQKYTHRKLFALYRGVPLDDASFKLLRKYFAAMANLYGIIPLCKAFEIIQEQNPDYFTTEELLAFAAIARHEQEDYLILGAEDLKGASSVPLEWELVDVFQASGVVGSLAETREMQRGKQWYKPSRDELLRYQETGYCEPTTEYKRFMGFLASISPMDETVERRIFTDIILKLRVGYLPFPDLMRELGQIGINVPFDQINDFVVIYSQMSNNFRRQCDRGHTPQEVEGLLGQAGVLKPAVTTEGIQAARRIELRKIGRNEPCPCGSGKKFKKCCGR